MAKEKNKRMIYIWEENLDFYEELENKSDFVNYALRKARNEQSHVLPDRISYIKQKIADMEAKGKL